jgi:anti-sigma B factor antagonist
VDEVTPAFSTGTERREGEVWVVRVTGELDMATAPKLQTTFDEVLASAPTNVLLDLQHLDFLDSTGITVLVRTRRQLEERGAHLTIDGLSAAAAKVLEVAGVLDSLQHPR